MCASFTRIQLENWLKTIDVKADSVIDIGGSQNLITGRVKSWDVKDYKILDLEKPHEMKRKPDIIGDLNYFEKCHYDKYRDYFDIAFCMEVSEYWFNPMTALENISNCLKKGGILYISFSFIYPVHEPVDQDYLRYTPRGVEKLLEETGFEILEMKHRLLKEPSDFMQTQEKLFNVWTEEGMRPAKNYDKHNVVGCLVKAQKKG